MSSQRPLPEFFLSRGSSCLRDDTWIQLDDFFEFDATALLSKHFAGKINRIGVMRDDMLRELLECALASEDISPTQMTIVENTLRRLLEPPQVETTHN